MVLDVLSRSFRHAFLLSMHQSADLSQMSHTPLHAAAASDQFEVLKVLLEAGEEDGDEGTVADLEARNMVCEAWVVPLERENSQNCFLRRR